MLADECEVFMSRSNLDVLVMTFWSFLSSFSSGRMSLRIASSTVSRSLGLLIDDFEVPDLNEY